MPGEQHRPAMLPYPGSQLLRHTDGSTTLVRSADRLTVAHDDPTAQLLAGVFAAARRGEPLDLSGLPESVMTAVEALYEQLRGASALVPRDEAHDLLRASPLARAIWSRGGEAETVQTIQRRLESDAVLVLGADPLAERIADDLRHVGCGSVHHAQAMPAGDDMPSLAVVVADSAEAEPAASWNRLAHEHRVPWLPVAPFDGIRASIGPLVVPGASACAECLRLRRASTFPAREVTPLLSAPLHVASTGPIAQHSGMELVIRGLVHDIVLHRLTLRENSTVGRPGVLTTVHADAAGPRWSEHLVLRVPRCAVCGVSAGSARPQVWAHRVRERDEVSA